MSGMKYQVGDRVKIKSFDWFRNGGCIGFSTLMSKYCGEVLTIQSKNNTNTYRMKEDGGLFCWSDDMIECVMNISKLGTTANPIEPKLNANCSTWEKVDGLATKIDKELPSGDQKVWELPDGYQFVDEDGNVINATKISLEKKKTEYPKTYEECCKILGIDNSVYLTSDEAGYWNDYELGLNYLIEHFRKLIICRDAYWRVYGEENGLGKPWEPTMETVYCISRNDNVIKCSYRGGNSNILEFPTPEMRDTFYENFKEEIEICKELL